MKEQVTTEKITGIPSVTATTQGIRYLSDNPTNLEGQPGEDNNQEDGIDHQGAIRTPNQRDGHTRIKLTMLQNATPVDLMVYKD